MPVGTGVAVQPRMVRRLEVLHLGPGGRVEVRVADMQGKSLVPLLKGERPADWRKSLYYHYYEYPSVHQVAAHFGIRTQRYKLIRFYQFDEWEFYDLEKDPDELRNSYGDPQYAEVVSTMKKDLDELRAHYKDDSDVSVRPDLQKKFRPQK